MHFANNIFDQKQDFFYCEIVEMKKVLIFDDDPDILELCSIILQGKGFTTMMELDCKNLISKIKEYNPDLILMDNWIPGMSGTEATLLLKKTPETAHIPVILFSANNNIESIARDANAEYFLKKPFDINELLATVDNAIGQENK